MLDTSPIDHASWWLSASNIIYVSGAVLTLAAAVHVLMEKRAVLAGKRKSESFWAEASVFLAALVSVLGTIGAIHYGNVVSHLKDLDLATYEKAADANIAQAQKDSADANKSAADAIYKNGQLETALAKHETSESKNDAELAKQNKATSDFAHALAQQQGIMAEQARVSPALSEAQIQELSEMLKPFAGQKVAVYSTSDTVVLRLGAQIKHALSAAGIDNSQGVIMMGALYQGVSVGVHDPKNVPPLANALVIGLRNFGIDAHPVSDSKFVPDGYVDLFLGPN